MYKYLLVIKYNINEEDSYDIDFPYYDETSKQFCIIQMRYPSNAVQVVKKNNDIIKE